MPILKLRLSLISKLTFSPKLHGKKKKKIEIDGVV